MLNSWIINIKLESGESEIFVSPLLLQSKERLNIKSGKIVVLYFYNQPGDDDYKAMVEKEVLAEKLNQIVTLLIMGRTSRNTTLEAYM